MELREIFAKQGGIGLIRQYWRNRVLFVAIEEFLILGKSRTALEILRLSTQLKIKQKLEKKYRKLLNEFDKKYDWTLEHKGSNKVWVCWFQGMENAPQMIQKCYESLNKHIKDREIILITSNNMDNYVRFPDFIQKKIAAGTIKGAHLSDLLRLELLLNYGGTWMDATIFCSSSEIPKYMFDSELFLFQNLKPGRDGHTSTISNWFITAKSNNRILSAVRYLLYNYWKDNNDWIDYFVFHDIFQIVIEKYHDDWRKVVPFSNATPHILLLRLFEKYNKTIWDAIKGQCCFHKLTYKFSSIEANIDGTYYKEIILKEGNEK